MTDLERWEQDGAKFGWIMPTAPWWKRLPVIRKVRYAWHSMQVDRHNAFHQSRGALISGYDAWVLFGIAIGKERPND